MAKKGVFRRLFDGLSKTRNQIMSKLDGLFGAERIDDEFYEELEEILITSDIGVRTTMDIIEKLQEQVDELGLKKPEECRDLLINSIREKMNLGENAYEFEDHKSVVLVIGVNGVGKTTSIGKLASQLKGQGKSVMLAAADTFRAGAIDQLGEWANRSGVPMISQQEGADPAAVVYDAVQSAKSKKVDVLICDTAGRLHNKKNLMDELAKINRIIDKEYPDAFRETLIVIDGMTGQNGLTQARQFTEVAKITGIILTKMDGTAKGGIAVAIQSELGVPVKYIGVGEGIDDLQKFNSEDFVNAMFTANVPEEDFEEEEAITEPEETMQVTETETTSPTEILPEIPAETPAETQAVAEPDLLPETTQPSTSIAVIDDELTADLYSRKYLALLLILMQPQIGIGSDIWNELSDATLEEDIEDPENYDWTPYLF